jgi:hypothetical protein
VIEKDNKNAALREPHLPFLLEGVVDSSDEIPMRVPGACEARSLRARADDAPEALRETIVRIGLSDFKKKL